MSGIYTELELINGSLRAFTSVAGYPLFYMDKKDNCLCVDCATESFLDEDELADFKPVCCAINYESAIYCDQCSEQIESAYELDDEDELDDY